jgi:replicative DNA helicase
MNFENTIPNEDILRLAEKEEPRLLSILLKDKDCLKDAISFGIKPTGSKEPGHFLMEKNNFLYAMIMNNYLKYGTLLTRSAVDSIIDMQSYGTEEDKASNKAHWDKIWNRHDATVEDYKILREHINDRYILWQFYLRWKEGEGIIKSSNDHSEMVKEFRRGINGIQNIDSDTYALTMGLEEGTKFALDHIKERREHPDSNDVIMTGFESIDSILNGLERGSYTVISGMVNGGKTTFMMNVGFNVYKQGKNVVYVSLEKKAQLFFRRILALHASTDYNRIKRGGTGQWGLTDFWYAKLIEAAKDLIERIKPNYKCCQFVPGTTLTKILSEVDKIRSHKPIDLLVIDYLQVIGTETHHIGRADLDLADVHRRIMAYGKEHNIAILTALQLKNSSSKEIRSKAKKVTGDADISSVEVNTEDYAGSQQVIADADNALGVVLNGDKPPTKMFVSFSKARDDESRRTIQLDFDGKIGRCSDPEYHSSQIKAVDKMIYDDKMSEKNLASDDDLFAAVEKEEKEAEGKEDSSSDSDEALFATTTTTTQIVKEKFIPDSKLNVEKEELTVEKDDEILEDLKGMHPAERESKGDFNDLSFLDE